MSGMTKADIVEAVYQKLEGASKKESSELVETIFEAIKETLANPAVPVNRRKIKISGFGNFIVKQKKERVGRNPRTGTQIKISARKVLTFKPSQVLKNALNH
jgi:integration host factor subunit alpha